MLENHEIPTPVLIKDLGYMFPKETSKQKKKYGIYQCHCGIEFKTQSSSINSRHTQSCGCYNKQRVSEVLITHGLSDHRLLNTWKGMIRRTSNIKHKSFKNYGGRGIKVCDRWLNVHNFIEDMYPTFQEGLTIDRINNNQGYSKDNCRWVSKEIQAQNTRLIYANNKSGYRGVSFCKADSKWRAMIGINGKRKYIGSFNTDIEAAKAYDKYVIENKLNHTINGVER